MDRIRSLSVGRKLILIYMLGIFAPLVIANGLVLRAVLRDAADQQRTFLQSAVDGMKNDIVREFEPISRVSEFVYADSAIYTLLSQRYERFEEFISAHRTYLAPSLAKYVSVFAGISRMIVYTENPMIQVAAGYLHLDQYARNSVWFTALSRSPAGVVAITHRDADPRQELGETEYVSFLKELDSPNMSRRGRLLLRIDVNPAVLLRHLEVPNVQGRVEVLDHLGNRVMGRRNGDPGETPFAFDQSIATEAPLATWRIRGEIAPTMALRPHRWLRLLWVSGLSILVSSFFILLLSRSVASRLASLSAHMRKVEQEDFSPLEVRDTSRDEIGHLIDDYNIMARKIGALINDGYKLEIERNHLVIARQQAELNALQSQVNPHFLNNVLESIRMKSIMKGEHETAQVVKKLSSSFRRVASWRDDLVKMQEELAFTREYLEIQQYRFGDELETSLDVDPGVESLRIPKMTIQSLVENACVHGIEQKRSGGRIQIRVTRIDGSVTVHIADDGVGCDAEAVRRSLRPGQPDPRHIGIVNVWRRLQLHYGERFEFRFESERDKGTSVTIRIEDGNATPHALNGR